MLVERNVGWHAPALRALKHVFQQEATDVLGLLKWGGGGCHREVSHRAALTSGSELRLAHPQVCMCNHGQNECASVPAPCAGAKV